MHLPLRVDSCEVHRVQLFRKLVVEVSDLLAEVSGTRVEHDPEVSLLVLLQLDEVVAAAQGTDLASSRGVLSAHHMQIVDVVALRHKRLLLQFLVVIHAERDPLPDARHDILPYQLSRDLVCDDVRLDSAHAASDVHSDGVGDDHLLGGEDASDRHPHTAMHIRHERQMMIHERQP